MYGYNIVSKITIRPHFFWKGKVHDYVLLSLKYKYCGRRVATVSDFANLTLKNIKFLIIWYRIEFLFRLIQGPFCRELTFLELG